MNESFSIYIKFTATFLFIGNFLKYLNLKKSKNLLEYLGEIIKTLFLSFAIVMTLTTQAYSECKNVKVITQAAESAFKRNEHPHASAPEYQGVTKTGKDKWMVTVSVQEECTTAAIVYTKEDSCEVLNAINLPLTDGACG